MNITTDRTCPSCSKPTEDDDALESLGDLRGWNGAGILLWNCPHCDTVLRIQQEEVWRGEFGQVNYYISVAEEGGS